MQSMHVVRDDRLAIFDGSTVRVVRLSPRLRVADAHEAVSAPRCATPPHTREQTCDIEHEMSDTTMVDAAAVVAPAADATAPTVTSAATEATAAAPTPAAIPNEAAAPSSTAAPTAPAAPAALPHPAEYYVIPSSASHSSAPTYSESELAAIAALPADSAGYMPVIKHRLVNPYGAAGASDDARKSRKTDRDASAPSSSAREGEAATTAGEGAAAASEETTENKKRKRGQNKTHEREIYNQRRDGPPQIRLCRATAAGLECKFMEKCKYSHDTSAFTATKAADYPGACPIFSKYGACPAGLMCKYASEGHADSFRPAELPAEPFTTPLSHELNMISKDLLADARVAGLAGRRYEKLFPRTVDLMKRHDAWKRQFDALRQKKQNEKQAAQKEQMRQMKAAREAALVARNEAAAAALNAPTAAAEAKTEPAAESVAAADASVPATDAPAAADAAPVAAPIAAPAAAEAPASAPAAPAITATTLPPTFVPNSADVELEIAAAKALYTPAFPMKVDPFQIVTDAYTDWSSGMILIDLERKKFEFNDKLVLAPLTTVGNLPFRLVCREFGCDVTIGEMALSSSLAKGTGSEWALLRRHQKEKYFGVQITGAFADQVSRACELINETCQVDFVDYNAGCPIDQVTDKGMGSAMMQRKRTKNLEPILRSMRTMLDCPVTLKMRMGWSTTEVRQQTRHACTGDAREVTRSSVPL